MLYVTTRNDQDTVTAQRALRDNRAGDGGFYVPFQDPDFSGDAWKRFAAMPFASRIAEVLNLLFQTQLTQWDLQFAIGRNPIQLVSLRHRITIGEFWHNPAWNFSQMEQRIARLLCKEKQEAGNWAGIAIRIAVFAAVLPDMINAETDRVDVSVIGGDFLWPISVWYARKWGFPVGNIIICCNENQNIWDLICHGQLRMDSVSISTALPEADIPVPADLERLIYGCGGLVENTQYLKHCREGTVYTASEETLSALQKGLFVSVVSSSRLKDTIPGILRTHQYLSAPGTALTYAGLLDYRAKKGVIRPSLVISEKSPQCDPAGVARVLGITEEALRNLV